MSASALGLSLSLSLSFSPRLLRSLSVVPHCVAAYTSGKTSEKGNAAESLNYAANCTHKHTRTAVNPPEHIYMYIMFSRPEDSTMDFSAGPGRPARATIIDRTSSRLIEKKSYSNVRFFFSKKPPLFAPTPEGGGGARIVPRTQTCTHAGGLIITTIIIEYALEYAAR